MSSSSDRPRILVLGGGSIGARHARNLEGLGAEVVVADPDPARGVAVNMDGLSGFDGVVVATPTVLHREHALAAVASGAAVLVEKPLAASVEGLDDLEDLVARAGDRLTVGYNLRLHEPVRRFRDVVASGRAGEVVSVRVWFGSFLPDWRPDVDYRATYSAHEVLGGGILLDASHELDLLVWLFGAGWRVEGAVVAHRSGLETDADDVVAAVLRSAEGMPAAVTLDAVSRRYRRGIEVVGEAATVRLDWAGATLVVEDAEGVTTEDASTPVSESYVREAEAFLDLVRGAGPPVVPAAEGAAVVRLCTEIRKAAGWPTRA